MHGPGRGRLRVPDGREGLQHVGACYLRDRHIPDAWEGVELQAAKPVPFVNLSGTLRMSPDSRRLFYGGTGMRRRGLIGSVPWETASFARQRSASVTTGDQHGREAR